MTGRPGAWTIADIRPITPEPGQHPSEWIPRHQRFRLGKREGAHGATAFVVEDRWLYSPDMPCSSGYEAQQRARLLNHPEWNLVESMADDAALLAALESVLA